MVAAGHNEAGGSADGAAASSEQQPPQQHAAEQQHEQDMSAPEIPPSAAPDAGSNSSGEGVEDAYEMVPKSLSPKSLGHEGAGVDEPGLPQMHSRPSAPP